MILHLQQQVKSILSNFDNSQKQKNYLFTHFLNLADTLYNPPDLAAPEQPKEGEQEREKVITQFNQQLDTQIKKAFRKLVEQQKLGLVGNLFEFLCNLAAQDTKESDASHREAHKDSKSSKTIIKNIVLINFLDDLLECVGVTDLKNILDIIGEKITTFKNLSDKDTYKLLKIINTLLKRISKTEDFYIRGSLQMTLTKILPLCHESGFHYRGPIAKPVEEEGQKQEEELLSIFSVKHSAIDSQFYEQFWELQKYFNNHEQLTERAHESDTSVLVSQSYIVKLNRAKDILTRLLKYFQKNSVNMCNDYSTFPLKFLKLPNLLQLQLEDGYFRTVLIIQSLMFCFSLRHPKRNPEIVENDKKIEGIISGIEKTSHQMLHTLDCDVMSKHLGEEPKAELRLSQIIKALFNNELNWIAQKDHWKEKKKTFFKQKSLHILEAKRKLYRPDQPPLNIQEEPSTTLPINIPQRSNQAYKQSSKKLNISFSSLEKFLKNTSKFHSDDDDDEEGRLTKYPQIPSFSYFLSQTEACLQTFDYENCNQVQFSTRSEYNLFEWKVYRSLYRQNIKDTTITASMKNVNEKLKEYRLLALVNKKRDDFYDNPTKKLKLDQRQGNEEEQKVVPQEVKQVVVKLREALVSLRAVKKQMQRMLKELFDKCGATEVLKKDQFENFLRLVQVECPKEMVSRVMKQVDGDGKETVEYDKLKKLILFDPY